MRILPYWLAGAAHTKRRPANWAHSSISHCLATVNHVKWLWTAIHSHGIESFDLTPHNMHSTQTQMSINLSGIVSAIGQLITVELFPFSLSIRLSQHYLMLFRKAINIRMTTKWNAILSQSDIRVSIPFDKCLKTTQTTPSTRFRIRAFSGNLPDINFVQLFGLNFGLNDAKCLLRKDYTDRSSVTVGKSIGVVTPHVCIRCMRESQSYNWIMCFWEAFSMASVVFAR